MDAHRVFVTDPNRAVLLTGIRCHRWKMRAHFCLNTAQDQNNDALSSLATYTQTLHISFYNNESHSDGLLTYPNPIYQSCLRVPHIHASLPFTALSIINLLSITAATMHPLHCCHQLLSFGALEQMCCCLPTGFGRLITN